jgi:hypothetical protein
VVSLHKVLGVTSYKWPSHWLSTRIGKWQALLAVLVGSSSEQFVYSKDHTDDARATRKATLHFASRCLAFPAMSTTALLMLLPRFASLPTQQGGLKEPDCRANALVLLQSLVRLGSDAGETWTLSVFGLTRWSCVWPRPAAAVGGQSVVVSIDDAQLHFDVLQADGFGVHSIFAKWHKSLTALVEPEATKISLVDLFIKGAKVPLLTSFIGQVLWQLASRIEWVIGQVAQSKLVRSAVAQFKWRKGVMKGRSADEFCATYLHGSQRALSKGLQYFLATDKGQACGLPLQDTIIGVSSLLVVSPPVVYRMHVAPIFSAYTCVAPPPPHV